MELCDEAGFYVLDEIPACWIANEVNNPSRTWAYTSPLQGNPGPRQEPRLRRRLELRQRKRLRHQ